jgi:hypothetical protein
MKLIKLAFLSLCAVLLAACASPTPDTALDDDTAEAEGAVIVAIDPTVILDAIESGATYDEGAEALVVGAALKYPYVDGAAWALGDDGLSLSPAVFGLLEDGELHLDPDSDSPLVATRGMYFQLAPVGGYAHLIDPQ